MTRSTNKVVFVNPRICKPGSARWPLSLLALASALDGVCRYQIIDGNIESDPVAATLAALREDGESLLAVTVMPGPQVAPAIEISLAARTAYPQVPIVWGGYFPTLYPDAALNAPYVDYVVRGQGEFTLRELLDRLPSAGRPQPAPSGQWASAQDVTALEDVAGLSWKDGQQVVHNPGRAFHGRVGLPMLPYDRLAGADRYVQRTFLGNRTAVHEVAAGCRYRCTFCGVASMYQGSTQHESLARLEQTLRTIRQNYDVNAMQYYDNNFFDREQNSRPVLDILAKFQMPWWCYSRADTLSRFSAATWQRIRKSRLRMTYIGAESSSDDALRQMKKGTKAEYTLSAARRCREYGVIPEFSFMLGGPEDPEGTAEETFRFIKRLKRIHPGCEIVLYFYTPTPQRDRAADATGQLTLRGPISGNADGPQFPTTPEQWTQPAWLNYACHQDAPWLSPRLRQRIRDFSRVLSCRFPTVQDYATPRWGKAILKMLSGWRYASGTYRNAWELDLARRWIPLREPQRESL